MIEIKLLIKKYFKHFLVLAGLCLAIWVYIYFVHGYTEYRYYDNGQIRTKIPYVNDKIHGIEKEYYENGQLESEIPYVNGKKHGVQKWYYENGKLKWKKPYKEDRRYGYGGYYDDKGKPVMPFYKPSSTKFDRYHFRTDLSRIFVAGYIWGENL